MFKSGCLVLRGLLGLAMVAGTVDMAMGQLIPANRRIEWTAGVPGGIPNRTIVFTNLTSAATVQQINSAISACPSNRVIQLGPGTYTMSGQLLFSDKRGVTLRGAGPTNTILRFTSGGYANIYFRGPNNRDMVSSGPDPGKLRAWTAGYAKGTTNITLASTTGLAVGNVLVLDQINDGVDVTDDGSEGCNYCSREAGERAQQQNVKVIGINGNVVTIYPGIYMPNYSASLSPQAYWWGDSTEMCGIEDLTVDNTSSSSTYGVGFANAYSCWVKNIRSFNAGMAHVYAAQGGRIEVRHSYLYGTRNAASQSYGVLWTYSSDNLCEDNIFEKITGAVEQGSTSAGCITAYNYVTNVYYTVAPSWMISGFAIHAAHNNFNLLEGNHGNSINMDFIHGSGSHNTVFRNRLVGWEPGKNNNTMPIQILRMNHYENIIGNILGKGGYHNKYEVSGANNSGDATSIYTLGYHDSYSTYPANYDPVVVSSLLRKGNYNYVTLNIPPSESLGTDTLPASLYLTSKPAWFGDRPWPPYSPLTPSVDSPTNIPAGFRFIYGRDPGPGGPVNNPPTALVSANPRSGPAPLAVAFSSAGSSDPEGATLTYSWAFGDGGTSTAANPNHTYSADGAYTATLTVSDGTNTASANVSISAGNLPPIVAASASPTGGPAPLNVNFSSAGSSDPEGQPLTYSWVFGDGQSSTVANPSHSYPAVGVYTARLTVSDGNRSVNSADIRISVGAGGAPGLVAALSFDEGSGNTVSDVSGNGNHGTINGATWTTNGRFGNALVFNGSGNLVSLSQSASLNVTSGVTLEAWVYPTTLGGWRVVLYKAVDVFALEGSTPQGSPSFGGTFSPSPMYSTAGALPLNTWTHLAGTYDGATMRLYVNGTQVAQRAQTGPIQVSNDPVTIGGDLGYSQWWAGRIDEVRIYNRALSASEITTAMETPVAYPQGPSTPRNFRIVGP